LSKKRFNRSGKGMFILMDIIGKGKDRRRISARFALRSIYLVLGSVILSFGLYNIHSLSGVTEGGMLGLTLLGKVWLNLSPAISGFVLNALCYFCGWRLLGHRFILYSAIAGGGFCLSYAFFEQFGPLWPNLVYHPLVACISGAAFVGVGVGLCVLAGGAPTGDDALAMGLSKVLHTDIRWIYLISDLVVLALSLSYIPVKKLVYSLLTVILSGQIVGWMQKISLPFLPGEKNSEESQPHKTKK